MENQIHPVVWPLPDAHSEQAAAEGRDGGRELLGQYLGHPLGGG